MDDKRLEIRISGDLLAAVDRARGELARAAWVKDALRKALGVLNSPQGVKARALAGSVPESREPLRVYTPHPAVTVGSCPECAGGMAPDGGQSVCVECGYRR